MSGELPLFPGLAKQVRGSSPDAASGVVDRLWRAVEARLRIDASIHRDVACWVCTYAVNHDGYAVMLSRPDHFRCHYISYVYHFGPLPEGFEVMHRCDNRRCVNPSHLKAGLHWQNAADMVGKRRSTRGRPRYEMTPCDVRYIRRSRDTLAELARFLGRSISAVHNVRRCRTHIEVQPW